MVKNEENLRVSEKIEELQVSVIHEGKLGHLHHSGEQKTKFTFRGTAEVRQIIAFSWWGRESCSQYGQKSELAHCGRLTQPPSFGWRDTMPSNAA